MKLTRLLITVTAISLAFTAMASAGSSDDRLKQLREECHKKATAEIETINDYYRGKLNQKLKSAKKFNKVDEIEAIEKELALLKEDSGYLLIEQTEGVAQFAGTWHVQYDDQPVQRILVITKEGILTVKDAFMANGDELNIHPWLCWGDGEVGAIKYDKETGMYICRWGNTTESYEVRGRRLKTTFWDGGNIPDGYYPDSKRIMMRGTGKRK